MGCDRVVGGGIRDRLSDLSLSVLRSPIQCWPNVCIFGSVASVLAHTLQDSMASGPKVLGT